MALKDLTFLNPNLFSKHTSVPTCANQFLYIVIFSKIPVSKPLIANEVFLFWFISFCAYFYYIAKALKEEELKEKNESLTLSVVRNWSYKLNVSAVFLQKRKLFQAMWQSLMCEI